MCAVTGSGDPRSRSMTPTRVLLRKTPRTAFCSEARVACRPMSRSCALSGPVRRGSPVGSTRDRLRRAAGRQGRRWIRDGEASAPRSWSPLQESVEKEVQHVARVWPRKRGHRVLQGRLAVDRDPQGSCVRDRVCVGFGASWAPERADQDVERLTAEKSVGGTRLSQRGARVRPMSAEHDPATVRTLAREVEVGAPCARP